MTIDKLPTSALTVGVRRLSKVLGFRETNDFILWLVFAGSLFAFSLWRLPLINFWGVFCNETGGPRGSMPGECFYYTKQWRYRIGIILHLATVLPASLLACTQFVPRLRQKAMRLHRINGYISVVLAILGTAGAVMIARRTAGGGVDVQSVVGVLAILFVGALTKAIISIRHKQIQQHRAWMIRAWAYGGVIVSTRIALFVAAVTVTYVGGVYVALPCAKISHSIGEEAMMTLYPQCAPFFAGGHSDHHIAIEADLRGNVVQSIAALNATFGTAVWVPLLVHMIGAELYLYFTSLEYQRLKNK
ncbi:hypothetical protein GGR50DRAFT_508803 [Xylaria sp. CBS 124048]|nr:hypothetical protein GGR50DRAFT_508803 [Xylaria sp. CBS 124048]